VCVINVCKSSNTLDWQINNWNELQWSLSDFEGFGTKLLTTFWHVISRKRKKSRLWNLKKREIRILDRILWPTERERDHDTCVGRSKRRMFGTTCRYAQFTPPARHDKTVLSLAWRCELDNCSERVQTSNFLSAGDSLELSGIQFTPPNRARHRQDSFVVSGVPVWISLNYSCYLCEVSASSNRIPSETHLFAQR